MFFPFGEIQIPDLQFRRRQAAGQHCEGKQPVEFHKTDPFLLGETKSDNLTQSQCNYTIFHVKTQEVIPWKIDFSWSDCIETGGFRSGDSEKANRENEGM